MFILYLDNIYPCCQGCQIFLFFNIEKYRNLNYFGLLLFCYLFLRNNTIVYFLIKQKIIILPSLSHTPTTHDWTLLDAPGTNVASTVTATDDDKESSAVSRRWMTSHEIRDVEHTDHVQNLISISFSLARF